jgi:DNA (cytosine-5)-methyltransferase 1
LYHWSEPRQLSDSEAIRVQAFPDDFKFLDQKAIYVCGMSVPPIMMAQVAKQIELQWLNKLV